MRTVSRSLVLLIALALAATACGDDSVLGSSPSSSAGETTTSATTPPTTAPPASTTSTTPPTTAAPPETTTTVTTTTTTLPPGPSIPMLTPFDAGESIDDPPLEMTVVIPIVSGVPDGAAAAMNGLISGEMLAGATAFKTEILEGDPADPAWTAEYALGYTGEAVTAEILSIRFDVYLYYPGAAHGLSGITTMNFDPQTGALLSLADVLVPGTFGVLAALVEQALTDQLYGGNAVEASGWIPVLDEAVLDGWAVTPAGMAFSFDQYEVGFGAMGSPTVVIPWADLGAVIDPAGPAAGYAFP